MQGEFQDLKNVVIKIENDKYDYQEKVEKIIEEYGDTEIGIFLKSKLHIETIKEEEIKDGKYGVKSLVRSSSLNPMPLSETEICNTVAGPSGSQILLERCFRVEAWSSWGFPDLYKKRV